MARQSLWLLWSVADGECGCFVHLQRKNIDHSREFFNIFPPTPNQSLELVVSGTYIKSIRGKQFILIGVTYR